MNRRAFITLLGGAAVWPLAARAQERERIRRIGALINFAADDMEGQRRFAAFLQALPEAGWEVGRNVRVDIRWAGDVEFQFQNCDGTACPRARRLSGCRCPHCAGAAKGYTNSADRIYKQRRSGRCWAGRKFGAAGRQCPWLFLIWL